MKKGQIMIFVAVGILVVVGAAFLFYFIREQRLEPEIEILEAVTADGRVVARFVEGCLDTRMKLGILNNALQGGYAEVTENYAALNYSNVPYYYDMGNVSIISLDEAEAQLELFINSNMRYCINDFTELRERGINVQALSAPTADVRINPVGGMDVVLDYDISVGAGETQEILETFAASNDIRIGTIIEIAQKIVTKASEDPQLIPLQYMTELNREYEVQINSLSQGSDVVMYMIKDEQSIIEGDTPLVFLFATRIDTANNAPVILLEESNFRADVGQEFSLVVPVSDIELDLLEFHLSSNAATIDQLLGIINFTPEQQGDYHMIILVSDGTNTASKTITVTAT
jgi:hypothetical protein